tara:strand:+ start:71 stop:373 length:303 start_codon:yes stop_codon:yes gene_type:complete
LAVVAQAHLVLLLLVMMAMIQCLDQLPQLEVVVQVVDSIMIPVIIQKTLGVQVALEAVVEMAIPLRIQDQVERLHLQLRGLQVVVVIIIILAVEVAELEV